MSSNLDVANRFTKAYNDKNVEAIIEIVDPQIEWYPAGAGIVEDKVYREHTGVAEYIEDLSESWEEMRVSWEEIRDFGDKVILLGHIHVKGKISGVKISQEFATVAYLKEGKPFKLIGYLDKEEAIQEHSPEDSER